MSAMKASCWFTAAGRFPNSPMARSWSRSCATTNCSGRYCPRSCLYYPTVTREPFRNRGRITDLITSEQLFNDIHQPPLDIETDRIMMCGSPGMLEELRKLFETRGFSKAATTSPVIL